jgi:hypothetical protein
MHDMKFTAFSIVILCAAIAGCSKSASQPTSPSGSVSGVSAADDGSTLKATAPNPVSPKDGVEVEDDTPELVIDNASRRFGGGVPPSYVFQVLDLGSNVLYESGPIESGDGQTSHEIPLTLEPHRSYLWRAYATDEGHRGPISSAVEFRVLNGYGTSCAHLGNELAIVQCRRAQFGFMSEGERVEFLRRIARDLGRASREHAPYGILIKAVGHSCIGYSCDIICSNAGGVHRQWDVLSDEDDDQIPGWSRLDRIAPRPCEVVH